MELPGDLPKILPFGRKLFQRGRPATQLIAVGRGDATAAEGELAAFGGEWER